MSTNNAVEVVPSGTSGIKSKQLQTATNTIARLQNEAKKNLFGIAVTLANIDRNKWYEQDGFKTTAEYAESVFNYKKAMTSALIRTANKYIDSSDKKRYHSVLAVNDKDYSVSQLQELLPLEVSTARELNKTGQIQPNMTTKKIREVVKSVIGKDKKQDSTEKQEEQTADGTSHVTEESSQATEENRPTEEILDTLVDMKEVVKVYHEINSMLNDLNLVYGDIFEYVTSHKLEGDSIGTDVSNMKNIIDKMTVYVTGLTETYETEK